MAVLIFLGCLLGGIAIGLPIAWALLLCGAALMFWLGMFDVQIMAKTLVNGADSFSLLAIPFFVLAGEIMNAITRLVGRQAAYIRPMGKPRIGE